MNWNKSILLIFSVIFISGTNIKAENAVWWEGEDAVKEDFIESDHLGKLKIPTRLSKMKWLNCYIPKDAEKKPDSFSAEYEINVPEDAEYTFWARELFRFKASPWKFRFDSGPWVEVKKDYPYVNIISLDEKANIVWCKYGKFKLSKGKHKFELKISAQNNKGFSAGFDAFLLTDVPFTPEGWKKPGVMSKYEYLGTYIWLEGEKAKTNFINKIPGIPQENPKLSEDTWLICSADSEKTDVTAFTAEWKFIIPVSDFYYLWIRELATKMETPFEYRFNNDKWKSSSLAASSFDNLKIKEKTSVHWVNYKTVSRKNTYTNPYLTEGENTFEIRVTEPDQKGMFKLAIDCICISLEPFYPEGKLKPDSEITIREGWVAFRPNRDPAMKGKGNEISALLRGLNEKTSGSHGFAKVDTKGIVFKDGTRARFWGVNAYEAMKMNKKSVDAFVSRMADMGVNLIRVKGSLCDIETRDLGKVNLELFDKLCYFISVCKSNGIYVALAAYSPEDYIFNSTSKFKGYKTPASPYGLLYINKKFRDKYKRWALFLRRMNPYTKITLSSDPTIVWFEIQNGGGLFTEHYGSIPKIQKQILEDEYNKWLIKRYGEIHGVLRIWSTPNKYRPLISADELESGGSGYRLLHPGTFTEKIISDRATDYMNKRKKDQLRFLIEHHQKINNELISYLKRRCSFKGLISLGNSSSETTDILRPVVQYIDSDGDIMGRNAYFRPFVLDNVRTLSDGLFYEDKSAINNPLGAPVVAPLFSNKATVTTEVSWPLPNKFRAEAVPLVSAYSALHGSDVYIWYNVDSPGWSSRLKKYTIQDPAIMGGFQAYALMFRRGDVAEGKTLVKYQVGLPDIVNLKGDNFSTAEYKDKIKLIKAPDFSDRTNLFASLAGKIEYVFNKKRKSTYLKNIDIGKYLDEKKGVIKSTTGELAMDYKRGSMEINTPRAQGITGFFQPEEIKKLKDVSVSFENKYGSILIISLDNKPIANSKHMLVKIFTEEMNNNWKTYPIRGKSYKRVDSLGESPLIVKKIKGRISFPKIKNNSWQIWRLDINGDRISEIKPVPGDFLQIELPSDSFQLELFKK